MQVKFIKNVDSAIIPKYQTEGASGFDFHTIEHVTLNPGETHLIDTGLSVELPAGTELQIRPRSGLSAKTGLRVANSPGTIDEDYRGPLKIILENTGVLVEEVQVGDRIAQGVIVPVLRPKIVEASSINETERGASGFGSTGV